MRVKIGDEWFDAKDAPICIRYSDEEREQIYQNTGYSYAQFPDNWGSIEEMREWMKYPQND